MSHTTIAILISLSAALAGWLQNGSVAPMALSLLVLLTSFAASVFLSRASLPVRTSGCHFVPWVLSSASLYLAIRLDRFGPTVDSTSSLPITYHLGTGLLWWLSSDLIFRSTSISAHVKGHQSLIGLTGGLLLVSAQIQVEEGLLDSWLLSAVATLPLATCAAKSLLPSFSAHKTLVLAILPASFAMSVLLFATKTAAEEARLALDSRSRDQRLPERNSVSIDDRTGESVDLASRRLPRDADIRFTGKTMLHLRAHSHELFRSWKDSPVYVRTYSLTLFESDEVISAIRSGRWIYDPDDGYEDGSVTLRPSAINPASLYTAYVSRYSAEHLPILNTSTNLHAPAIYEFADDWYQLTPPEKVTHLQYKGSAMASSALDEFPDYDPGRLKQPDAPSIYLNLPPSPLSSRITELSADFDGKDPLGSIRNHFKRNASYSLRFSTPADSSPVEDFLFGSRRGHCEHYAAATVLFLRSLGIPSRIAYGYAGGSADSRQRIVAFRDSDFHAWAEIMAPDRKGWIIFDTTPGPSGTEPKPPSPANLPILNETAYHNFSATSIDAEYHSDGLYGRIGAFLGLLSNHFLASSFLGLVLVAVLSRVLMRQSRRTEVLRSPSRPLESTDPLRPRFIDELIMIANEMGIHRKPGHTVKEVITGLSRDHPLPEGINSSVSYYYSVSYCGSEPDPMAEKHFLNAIRDWGRDARPD